MTDESRVLILTTGGTIDKAYFDGLNKYQFGESVIGHLLKIARVRLPFRIIEVTRKDSLEIDDDDRKRLAELVCNTEATRIVITHGTDTMTTTAAALADVQHKTIVLVGALTPARFSESDASFNLGMAFATCQIAPSSIYICMNGTVFHACDVVKDRAAGAFMRKRR